jgi:hypothetical protein
VAHRAVMRRWVALRSTGWWVAPGSTPHRWVALRSTHPTIIATVFMTAAGSAAAAERYPSKPGGGSPQELSTFMQRELERTRRLVKQAGLPVE